MRVPQAWNIRQEDKNCQSPFSEVLCLKLKRNEKHIDRGNSGYVWLCPFSAKFIESTKRHIFFVALHGSKRTENIISAQLESRIFHAAGNAGNVWKTWIAFQ